MKVNSVHYQQVITTSCNRLARDRQRIHQNFPHPLSLFIGMYHCFFKQSKQYMYVDCISLLPYVFE